MMSQLCADYFHRSPVLAWPIAALALFMTVFVVVTVRALLRRPVDIQRMAELPLRDTTGGNDHG
ncbi:MAG: hypothetical protein ABW321_08085 [Polyangiales bacterium]